MCLKERNQYGDLSRTWHGRSNWRFRKTKNKNRLRGHRSLKNIVFLYWRYKCLYLYTFSYIKKKYSAWRMRDGTKFEPARSPFSSKVFSCHLCPMYWCVLYKEKLIFYFRSCSSVKICFIWGLTASGSCFLKLENWFDKRCHFLSQSQPCHACVGQRYASHVLHFPTASPNTADLIKTLSDTTHQNISYNFKPDNAGPYISNLEIVRYRQWHL